MPTQTSKNGSGPVKFMSLDDKETLEILKRELEYFNRLVKGHEKLLQAIGEL